MNGHCRRFIAPSPGFVSLKLRGPGERPKLTSASITCPLEPLMWPVTPPPPQRCGANYTRIHTDYNNNTVSITIMLCDVNQLDGDFLSLFPIKKLFCRPKWKSYLILEPLYVQLNNNNNNKITNKVSLNIQLGNMGITPKINSNTLLALWSGFTVHRTADCGLWVGSRWARPPFAGFLGWVYSARDCGLYGVGSQIASFGGRFTGPQIAGFMGWVHIVWASWVGFTGPQIVGFVWFHRATDCGLCGVDSQIAGFVGWEVHRAENGRQVLLQGILRLILTHLPQTSLTHILITPALVQCWVNVPMVGIWPTPMVGIFYIVTQLHVTPCVLQDVYRSDMFTCWILTDIYTFSDTTNLSRFYHVGPVWLLLMKR